MSWFRRNVEQRVAPGTWVGIGGIVLLVLIFVWSLSTGDNTRGFWLGNADDPMYVYRVIFTDGATGKIDTALYHVTAQAYDYHREKYNPVDDYVQLTDEGINWLIKKFTEEQEVMAGCELVVQVAKVNQ